MIASTANQQVKHVVNLRDKAKVRREERLFVAEGLRMCRELEPGETEQVYVTKAFAAEPENRRWLENFSWELVTDSVMEHMAGTRTPQGVMALVRQKNWKFGELLRDGSDGRKVCLLVLEKIQDPGNLGTMLRAGEGAGITGVVMSRDTADLYNPKVIRSTMGSILRVPFVYVDDLQGALEQMKKAQIRLFAAHLQGSVPYDQEDYRGRTAFLIGNEANGLTDQTAGAAHCPIRIPMAGRVESLNAAVAASVLMFEAARQRRRA